MPRSHHLPYGFCHRHGTGPERPAAELVPTRNRRALVGIQREIDVPDQELTIPGLGERLVHHPEIAVIGDTNQ